jgi:predicted MPP superfamily phosphohydrolase
MRRAYRVFLPGLLGLLAAVWAVMVTPSSTVETDVGLLEVAVRPGLGGTELAIPPLGSVRASTHRTPFEVRVELSRVELAEASRVTSTARNRAAAVQNAEEALHGAFVRHALLSLTVAAATAGVLAAARRRRSGRLVSWTVAAAVLPLAGVGAWTMATFEPAAFTSPTFQGSLAEAPGVLKKLDSAMENVGVLRNRLAVVTDQLEALTAPLAARKDSLVMLHVSDIHSNPVGVAWVDELVQRFEPDVVVDTGDVTSFGVEGEGAVMERLLETTREKYMVVFGNHDSSELRNRLSKRLTAIHEQTVTVNGVTLLGLDDPTYTAKEGSQASDDPKYAQSGERLRVLCESERPVVVAVHNPAQASYVDGCAEVVLSGHLHTPQQYRLKEGTLVSVVGTTGASGIEGLNPNGRYHAELLRFDGRVLHSIDVVEMNPTTGEVVVRRVVVARVRGKR